MSLLDDIKRLKSQSCNKLKNNKARKQKNTLLRSQIIPSKQSKQKNSFSICQKFALSQQLQRDKEQKNSDANRSNLQNCKSTLSTLNIHTKTINQFQKANINFSDDYFKDTIFCFPARDIELSKNRVRILQGIVKKRKGKILSLENVLSLNPSENELQSSQILIVSTLQIGRSKIFSQHLKLQNSELTKNRNIIFIDYDYICSCEKMGRKLDIKAFQLQKHLQQKKIDLNQNQHRQIQNEQFSFQYGYGKKKIKKTESVKIENIRDNFFKHQDETDTEFLSTESLSHTDTNNSLSKKKTQINANSVNSNNNLSNILDSQNKTAHKYPKKQPQKEKFACHKGSNKCEFFINQFICEQLMKLQQIYENEKDFGRTIAYMKAISAIKSYHKQIQSQKDIAELRGIGIKICKKIKQLLDTGKIQKLEKLKSQQCNICCTDFSRIWGIGPSKAKQLYDKGIKSIQELKGNQQSLNKNQRVGLKYLEEFQTRIPRKKAGQIFEIVEKSLLELTNMQSLHQIQVCGSYRRGKQTCGDVDIIITRKDGKFQTWLLLELIEMLEKKGFLTDHLSLPTRRSIEYDKSITYMGVCALMNEEKKQLLHHRIDIKYYPRDQYAYALLYFTGSSMFNRSMRLYARRKGYTLTDKGMCLVERNNGTKTKIGQNIAVLNQRQIFEYLGLDYKAPHERNV